MKRRSVSVSAVGERKSRLRRLLREKRDALPERARIARSKRIARALARVDEYCTAGVVMFYMTHGSEVRTDDAIRSALADGKTVALPRIDPTNGRLTAVRIASIDTDTVPGAYGIREPRRGRILRPAAFDAVLVPGVAFDRAGNRIGYGKGYYDRWLRRIDRRKRIALAYDFQVVGRVSHTPRDLPVGMIITDKRVLRCTPRKKRKRTLP